MELRDFNSKSIKDVEYKITSYDDVTTNITPHVVSVSIYESLFNICLVGEVVLFDKVGLLDTIPIMGQELFNIEYTNGDEDYSFEFHVTDIKEFTNVTEGGATYTLYLSGKKEMMNAIQTVSKSYSGLTSDIMNKIYKDYLNSNIENLSSSSNSMNIVIPFMKPFQALKMILKNSISNNKTPMFLFEDSKNETNLVSLYDLQTKEPLMELYHGQDINLTGNSTRKLPTKLNKIFTLNMRKGFDTYKNIQSGAYAGFVNKIDLSTKNYERLNFSYLDHSPFLEEDLNDSITSNWTINDEPIYELYNSNFINAKFNSLAFENSSNFIGTDPFRKIGYSSYYTRIDNVISTAYTNSYPGLKAGDKITINYKRPIPNIDSNERTLFDEHISGNYIISSLRHHIKNFQYDYSMELIKEGTLREL